MINTQEESVGQHLLKILRLPQYLSGKEPACNSGAAGQWVQSWGWKIPWKRKWQSTAIFLLGESSGQRSLAGYSPWVTRVRHN